MITSAINLAVRTVADIINIDYLVSSMQTPSQVLRRLALHSFWEAQHMKPAHFDYACPASLAEVISLLATHGDEAKVISGGQSLMPMLAFRMAAPKLLVDLRAIRDLDRIDIGADGVRLGAKVTWRDIELSAALAEGHPLLSKAIKHVAHYQIRNRGTVGGSLAHADPSAEMPGIAVACDGVLTLVGPDGTREVAAADFFQGPLSTDLAPDEIIISIQLPPWPKTRRWGFEEFARRRGDFAIAAAATFYDLDQVGQARDAHFGVIGVGDTAMRLNTAEAVLNGRTVDQDIIAQAAAEASRAINPANDIHASAEYRRDLLATLVERALIQASA
jgi:aerobic carbon-monoxide dehydrogenase medium subunit